MYVAVRLTRMQHTVNPSNGCPGYCMAEFPYHSSPPPPYPQVVQWDLAVEKDTTSEQVQEVGSSEQDPNVPPQLLFIHQVGT